MGKISADTLRRIYLLYLLGQFQNGSYGLIRLQKVAYISERDTAPVKPFTYRKHLFGEYSDELDDYKDQLAAMGFIGVVPLDTANVATIPIGDESVEYNLGGNRLYLRDSNLVRYETVLDSYSATMVLRIRRAVSDYGYLPQQELLDKCYAFPEFAGLKEGETIYESNLPDLIEVDLPDDECDDLELAMNPEFVMSMSRLNDALDEKMIDWSRVGTVEQLRVPGS